MDRELKVGEVLSETFAIYRDQAGVLLPVAFWLFLPVAIANVLTENDLALLYLSGAFSLAVGTLYGGLAVALVRDLRDGKRDSSVGDLFEAVTPVLLPLLGAGILYGLGVFFGIFLFIVPGLYLLTVWAVVAPVIVVERRSVFEAFGRSRGLVKGNGWPVFGSLVVALLVVLLAAVVLATIAAAVADEVLILIVVEALGTTATAPIPALVGAVLYFRLRDIQGDQAQGDEASVEARTAPEPPTVG